LAELLQPCGRRQGLGRVWQINLHQSTLARCARPSPHDFALGPEPVDGLATCPFPACEAGASTGLRQPMKVIYQTRPNEGCEVRT
jgi:hypothetical protein